MGSITSKKGQQLQPVVVEQKPVVGRWRSMEQKSIEVHRNYANRARFFRRLFKAK